MVLRFDRLAPYLPFLLNGIWPVIILSLVAAFFGCVIGFIAALAKRKGGIIGSIFGAYIDRLIPVFLIVGRSCGIRLNTDGFLRSIRVLRFFQGLQLLPQFIL